MELLDWITLLIIFALGFSAGWRVNDFINLSMFKSLLSDLGISNQQLLKVAKSHAAALGIEAEEEVRQLEELDIDSLEQIDIKVEKHGETLYAFRADNDQFLGQGIDKESLIEAMKYRVKNVRMSVVEGDEYLKSNA